MAVSRKTTIAQLAAAVPEAAILGDAAVCVSGISYDSRQVAPESLFAALRGADLDGHAFVHDAAANGAAALLVEEPTSVSLPQIVVSDTRAALARISARFFAHPSEQIGVVGITGTDGKTTTSYLVDHILRTAGLRTGLIGTVAIRIDGRETLHSTRQTTPESSDVQGYLRAMANAGTDWATIEATSHGLAMHRLDEVTFRIGAITNITHEHLDFHGSVDAYRRAKAILLERIAEVGGAVVINADDEGARSVLSYASGAKIICFSPSGQAADAQLTARSLEATADGSCFLLDAGSAGSAEVRLPLIGQFNVDNALCAAAVALAVGLDLGAIAAALSSAPSVPGRMANIVCGQPFSVVVDYAHTPDSLEKVIRLLKRLHPAGRTIVVFGSAGDRDTEKRALQGSVVAANADIGVVTSEDPRCEDPETIIDQICEGALASGAILGRTLFRDADRRVAIEIGLALAQPGDCVLLAGKGHESSIIWGREQIPWDEAGTARELIAKLGCCRN